MKNHMKSESIKKGISFLIIFLIVISCLTGVVFAEDESEQSVEVQELTEIPDADESPSDENYDLSDPEPVHTSGGWTKLTGTDLFGSSVSAAYIEMFPVENGYIYRTVNRDSDDWHNGT